MKQRDLAPPVLGIVASLILSSAASAFDITLFAVNSGGGTCSGGSYALVGTIGQSKTGLSFGSRFALSGGFWAAGYWVPTGVDPPPGELPLVFRLHAASPNPFHGAATIRFDLPEPSPVHIRVFDVQGRKLETLADDLFPAGRHEVVWRGATSQGRAVSSGIYIIHLRAGRFEARQKIALIQ